MSFMWVVRKYILSVCWMVTTSTHKRNRRLPRLRHGLCTALYCLSRHWPSVPFLRHNSTRPLAHLWNYILVQAHYPRALYKNPIRGMIQTHRVPWS